MRFSFFYFLILHLWDVENATTWSSFKSSAPLSVDNTPCKFGGNCSLDTDGDGVADHLVVYADTDPLNPTYKFVINIK